MQPTVQSDWQPIFHRPAFDAQRGATVRRLGRALRRGVTLVEILIVVSIMTLIAAGVAVAVLPKFKGAQIDTATNNAREIRNAAGRWRATHGGEQCPTISMLIADKEIDSASKTDDPWGSAYKINCMDDDTQVTSPGPDKRDSTADDIQVPKVGPSR